MSYLMNNNSLWKITAGGRPGIYLDNNLERSSYPLSLSGIRLFDHSSEIAIRTCSCRYSWEFRGVFLNDLDS